MTARSPKVVGDAIHVLFNAPGDQPDYATRAVACAHDLDSRAEGISHTLEGSARVAERVQNFQGRPAGDLILRGRSEPLRAYEPLPSRRQR
jgi:class 3 adenylate cyclase